FLAHRAPHALGDAERWTAARDPLFRRAAAEEPRSVLFREWQWCTGSNTTLETPVAMLRAEVVARFLGRGLFGEWFRTRLTERLPWLQRFVPCRVRPPEPCDSCETSATTRCAARARAGAACATARRRSRSTDRPHRRRGGRGRRPRAGCPRSRGRRPDRHRDARSGARAPRRWRSSRSRRPRAPPPP